MLAAVSDQLFAFVQRLIPTRLLGRLVYRISRSRRKWLKNGLIRLFCRAFAVDTTEMDRPDPCDYPSFNAFFTRELRPGARTVDDDPIAVCSPADGTVQQIGHMTGGQLIQAKGIEYSLSDLLGLSAADTSAFAAGAYLTIYLAPHNYHRVHMPVDGSVTGMNYLPGRRLAVNQATARTIPGLFAGNERLACDCLGQRGPYWLIFVGAMNVASISTAWAGEVLPGTGRPESCRPVADTALNKGDYCGHFNMGSTVILIFPNNTVAWDPGLNPGAALRVGQRVGSLIQ